MKKVSLKVIASEVGVSVATVSLVLNGKNKNGRVSKKVSQEIIKKAKQLNYTPNSIAKSLKIGRSKTIGLIVADISNAFFGTLAFYIQNFADKAGYTVLIGNTNEQPKVMEKMINLFKARQVDGLIITPTEESEDIIKEIINQNIPLVLVDRSYPNLTVNSVLLNNYEISYKSVSQLVKQGCKNIGLITYNLKHYHLDERKRGYQTALKDRNFYNEDHIKLVRYSYLKSDVEKAIDELLKNKQGIDGIFFTTNSISMHAIKVLLKNKIQIGKDIQIMCFDENEAFYLLPSSISFIKQPIEIMANKSINLLLNQIENNYHKTEKCYINAELVLT